MLGRIRSTASKPAYMGARKIVGLAGTIHKDRQWTGQQLSEGLTGVSSLTITKGL
jgi:hypothetical protein